MKKLMILMMVMSMNTRADVPSFYSDLSKETNVPVDVLFALAATETNTLLDNGKVLPWPYSINLNGKPEYFSTSQEMLQRASNLVKQGVIHFDCGLFQVNWKWNGRHRASSLKEACSPKSNGLIASNIIKGFFANSGDWIDAAGKYHNPSNNNGAADIYKERFATKWKYAKKLVGKYD